MRYIFVVIAFIFFCFWGRGGYAFQIPLSISQDTLTTQSWGIDDGLPVNTLNTMVQDEVGYLWISTYDGLVRFDGREFEIFNHANTPEIPHNRMTSLYHQKGVGTWISMEYSGILLYKDNQFTYFGVEDGLSDSHIRWIGEISDGRMIFIANKGLFQYLDGEISAPYKLECVEGDQIFELHEDNQHALWVAAKGCLVKINPDGSEEYFLNNASQVLNVLTVHQHSDGFVYAGTDQGLYVLNEEGESVANEVFSELKGVMISHLFQADDYLLIASEIGLYSYKEGRLNRHTIESNSYYGTFTKINKDREGRYWLTSGGGKLAVFDHGSLSDLPEAPALSGLLVNKFYEDREGNKWLLTTKNGLLNLKRSKVRTIGVPEGLSGDNILGLMEDSKGRFWIGTRGSGLNMISGGKVHYYNRNTGLKSNVVHTILEDDEGRIWVGNSSEGIDLLNGDKVAHYDLGGNIESNDVRGLYQDSKGNIWATTYQGLVLFDPVHENHIRYTQKDGLGGNKLRYVTEDHQGGLWIGTLHAGISYYKDGNFTNYSEEDGLSSNNIRSIYVDERETGTIWIGTENNGLNRFRNGEFRFVNMEDGLPDYNIHWVSQDDFGWLWLSSNKGMFKVNKQDLNNYLDGKESDYRIVTYGSSEGMRNPEGNGSFQEAGIRVSDGRFWFPTQAGVAIIDSKESDATDYEPPVVIKEVLVGQEPLLKDSVIVKPSMGVVRINYEVLTYANSDKSRFRYRLNNDQEWILNGRNREIFLSGLKPGDYRIQIEATDSQGSWSSKAAILPVTILPKVYQKAWFYILLIAGLAGFYYLILHFRTRMLVARQEKLTQIIDEQTLQIREEKTEIEKQKKIIEEQAEHLSEANKTKDKFFSIIAHDLRNPFQALVGYSDMMLGSYDKMDATEIRESFGVIKDASVRLLELTNNLLSWANLQTGKMKADIQVVQLSDIVSKNKSIASQIAEQKGIILESSAPKNLCVQADPNMIDSIFRNILSNALKFTPSGGRVSLQVYEERGWGIFKVTDTGIGMNDKILASLMKPDSGSSRHGTNREPGTGLGLILCKEMIELNKGMLEIESMEGKGSTFRVLLPLVNSDD